MIEVYNDCPDKKETTLPQPKLKLIAEGKRIHIHAVDENGEYIASLWSVKSNGETLFHSCSKGYIKEGKHSTDWAEWDEKGRFVKLT